MITRYDPGEQNKVQFGTCIQRNFKSICASEISDQSNYFGRTLATKRMPIEDFDHNAQMRRVI